MAIVIEGYNDTLKENNAIFNPGQVEELLDKWSQFDPEATGFINPDDLVFLLLELD